MEEKFIENLRKLNIDEVAVIYWRYKEEKVNNAANAIPISLAEFHDRQKTAFEKLEITLVESEEKKRWVAVKNRYSSILSRMKEDDLKDWPHSLEMILAKLPPSFTSKNTPEPGDMPPVLPEQSQNTSKETDKRTEGPTQPFKEAEIPPRKPISGLIWALGGFIVAGVLFAYLYFAFPRQSPPIVITATTAHTIAEQPSDSPTEAQETLVGEVSATPTITPIPPTSTATVTPTNTPQPTNTFTPVPTATPEEVVFLDHSFSNGIDPKLTVEGPWTIKDGALTSIDYTPIVITFGDSSWKNYEVDLSFRAFNTDSCDFYLGVRKIDRSMLAVKFVRPGRLGWWTFNNGKWAQVAGDEHLIPFAPLTIKVIVQDMTYDWQDYSKITLPGYEAGSVEIHFPYCATMDTIKVVQLP